MNNKKTAVIFGVTGQDGSYLAESLIKDSTRVVGIGRRSSVNTCERLSSIIDNSLFHYVEGDVTDFASVSGILNQVWGNPVEIYNLSAQSHVGTSFNQPLYTFDVNAKGILNILEYVRQSSSLKYKYRIYQASTSEMFGKNYTSKSFNTYNERGEYDGTLTKNVQDENTPFDPQSPYAVAKVAAHHLVKLYRESYDVYACSGILFNHESPRRGENFVTRKITKYVASLLKWMNKYDIKNPIRDDKAHEVYIGGRQEISQGFQFPLLKLGNLDAYRDWGYAPDYVEVMRLMLTQEYPRDFVVGTGEVHRVSDFLEEAFNYVGLRWMDYVEIDKGLIRPAEVPYLCADASLIKEKLGWESSVTFKELVHIMIDEEIKNTK